MKYGHVPGLSKRVSRLVMGCDTDWALPRAVEMYDDFFERGGKTFDTAYLYRDGQPERNLGQWIRDRNLRERVVVIGKGAHTPNCNPCAVTEQLNVTLERLQMDDVDIYFLHRDNLDFPASAFIDVLNEHHRAGRIKTFGGSNWTIPRVIEANEYAAKNGLVGFRALSNNFSLARMVNPPWAGVVAASDPDSRAWLTESQMVLMPWSSQAMGFFTDRAAPDKQDDEILVRGWYSDGNFERRRRAAELGARKGVEPTNIALAYVLNQPFPTFALIGPAQVSETTSNLRALEVTLTPEERKWLDLEKSELHD